MPCCKSNAETAANAGTNKGGKAQALRQKFLATVAGAEGVSQRLLLLDTQADKDEIVFKSVLQTVAVVRYDSSKHTIKDIAQLVYEAHKQNKAPFMSIAIGNAGPCLDYNSPDNNMWLWGKSEPGGPQGKVNLNKVDEALDQFAPLLRYLCSALQKTHMGHAHIDFLAGGLAMACKGFIPALEELYGVDFRGSDSVDLHEKGVRRPLSDYKDDAKVDRFPGIATIHAPPLHDRSNWTMETDGGYDAGPDYLDWKTVKYNLKALTTKTVTATHGDEEAFPTQLPARPSVLQSVPSTQVSLDIQDPGTMSPLSSGLPLANQDSAEFRYTAEWRPAGNNGAYVMAQAGGPAVRKSLVTQM